MEELKKIKVVIFGKNYVVSTDENEEDVFKAAEQVDFLLKKFATGVSVKDEAKATVLIALQLAMDLVKNKKTQDLWQTKTNDLTVLLDSETE